MKISLITTTYNWKEALQAVLKSAFKQTRLPDEIIVGDDGSREDTVELVKELQKVSPVPLHHVWQEDDGFQLSRIRNKAIAKATGDYIILIDGDMVLESHFIEDHEEAAEKGFFVQGGRVMTQEKIKDELIENPLKPIGFFSGGIKNRKNTLRSDVLSKLASGESVGIKGIRTCNFAVWREDAVNVNGFNESFVGWGFEDWEFVVRLFNCGVRRKNLKHKAIAYHLYHKENSRDSFDTNDELLDLTIKNELKRCELGIEKYL